MVKGPCQSLTKSPPSTSDQGCFDPATVAVTGVYDVDGHTLVAGLVAKNVTRVQVRTTTGQYQVVPHRQGFLVAVEGQPTGATAYSDSAVAGTTSRIPPVVPKVTTGTLPPPSTPTTSVSNVPTPPQT